MDTHREARRRGKPQGQASAQVSRLGLRTVGVPEEVAGREAPEARPAPRCSRAGRRVGRAGPRGGAGGV